MATITCTFDTKTKDMTVVMDGQELPNVKAACFHDRFDDDGKFFAEITMVEDDDDNKIRRLERLSATSK